MTSLDLEAISRRLDTLCLPVASGPNAFWQLRHDRDHAIGTARTLLAEVERLRGEEYARDLIVLCEDCHHLFHRNGSLAPHPEDA